MDDFLRTVPRIIAVSPPIFLDLQASHSYCMWLTPYPEQRHDYHPTFELLRSNWGPCLGRRAQALESQGAGSRCATDWPTPSLAHACKSESIPAPDGSHTRGSAFQSCANT